MRGHVLPESDTNLTKVSFTTGLKSIKVAIYSLPTIPSHSREDIMVATLLQRFHRSVVLSNRPINALIQLSTKSSFAAVSGGYDLQFKDNNNKSTTSYLLHQTYYSSTSYKQHKVSDGGSDTEDLHSLYHDQMKEIQSERESIFGKESEEDPSNQSPDLSQTAKSYFKSSNDSTSTPQQSLQQTTRDTSTTPQFRPPNWNTEEYEAAAAERDALYDFTDEEKSAWSSNNGTETLSSLHMLRIREMIRQAPDETADSDTSKASETTTQQTSQFSHLTPQGDGVSMVDVGHKVSSRRVATARSVVVFPPEVMSAFQVNNNEIVGHKGPIFETAKIAGIMGAK